MDLAILPSFDDRSTNAPDTLVQAAELKEEHRTKVRAAVAAVRGQRDTLLAALGDEG